MPHKVLRIARMGEHAARALRSAREACVVAVFDKACYVEAAGKIVCVGIAEIGDGPINALMTPCVSSSWLTIPVAGQTIEIDSATAEIWTAPPWPDPVERDEARRSAARLRAVLTDHAPADGLCPIVLGETTSLSALSRVAMPRIVRFNDWLVAQIVDGVGGLEPPVDLLGLGPGLTPSGDDVIGGACIALAAVGRSDVLRRLADAVLAAAPAATSAISAAFLAAAADGQGSARFHAALIAALANGPDDVVARSILLAADVGATSGWDALAGALLVLEAFGSTAAR